MTAPIWSGPVSLRWDGERLMLGRLVLGHVRQETNRVCAVTIDGLVACGYPSMEAARAALLDAAVKALEAGDALG